MTAFLSDPRPKDPAPRGFVRRPQELVAAGFLDGPIHPPGKVNTPLVNKGIELSDVTEYVAKLVEDLFTFKSARKLIRWKLLGTFDPEQTPRAHAGAFVKPGIYLGTAAEVGFAYLLYQWWQKKQAQSNPESTK